MTHRLRERHPKNAITNPLVVNLRYRCECAQNEVLSISVVLDMETTEECFVWTMRQLWDDVKFEVEQHIKRPDTVTA